MKNSLLLQATKKLRSGFTLVEMLLYIGIASIILVIALQTMIRVLETRKRSTASAEVQQSLRITTNRIIDTSLNATGINVGSSVFGSTNGTLSFSMNDSTVNPTIFTLSNSAIYVTTGAQAPLPITSPAIKVDTLLFTNLTPSNGVPAVRIEIHASQSGSLVVGQSQTMNIDTSFSLRR